MEPGKARMFGKFIYQAILGWMSFEVLDWLASKLLLPGMVYIKGVVVEATDFSPTKNLYISPEDIPALVLLSVLIPILLVVLVIYVNKVESDIKRQVADGKRGRLVHREQLAQAANSISIYS